MRIWHTFFRLRTDPYSLISLMISNDPGHTINRFVWPVMFPVAVLGHVSQMPSILLIAFIDSRSHTMMKEDFEFVSMYFQILMKFNSHFLWMWRHYWWGIEAEIRIIFVFEPFDAFEDFPESWRKLHNNNRSIVLIARCNTVHILMSPDLRKKNWDLRKAQFQI